MARNFTRMAAQGDFIIMRIDDIPLEVEPVQPENGVYVVAHSETGHNHVMVADRVTAYQPKGVKAQDLYELFFSVKSETKIEHLRSFDTHEALNVTPGNYKVVRQREYVAEGFRRAQD